MCTSNYIVSGGTWYQLMALLAKPSFTPGFYFRVTFTLLKLKWAGILTCSYMFIHIERCSCSSNYRWKIMNCKDLTFAKKVTHTHTHTARSRRIHIPRHLQWPCQGCRQSLVFPFLFGYFSFLKYREHQSFLKLIKWIKCNWCFTVYFK